MAKKKTFVEDIERTLYDIRNEDHSVYKSESGLTPDIIRDISRRKHDPAWMTEFRLKALDTYNHIGPLENFEKVFSKKELPTDMPEFKPEAGALLSAVIFAAGAAPSKNKARGLIDQGAVRLKGEKVTQDGPLSFENGDVLQIGKRHFFKLVK